MERLAEGFVNAVGAAVGALFSAVLPWWAPYVFWGVVATIGIILILLVLKLVKDVLGWPGVAAAVTAIASVASGVFGFVKGRAFERARQPKPAPAKKSRKPLFGRKQ